MTSVSKCNKLATLTYCLRFYGVKNRIEQLKFSITRKLGQSITYLPLVADHLTDDVMTYFYDHSARYVECSSSGSCSYSGRFVSLSLEGKFMRDVRTATSPSSVHASGEYTMPRVRGRFNFSRGLCAWKQKGWLRFLWSQFLPPPFQPKNVY